MIRKEGIPSIMLKIGVIGCGKIAQVRHIPEYAANENVELAGFYNPTKSRAEDMVKKYGGRVYDTAEELLSDESIDAVSVCSANYSHAELAIKALRAGKDVLCEKPMATTLEDCMAMVAAAKESGKRLMIGQNQRLAKAHVEAKKFLDAGLIGSAVTFRTGASGGSVFVRAQRFYGENGIIRADGGNGGTYAGTDNTHRSYTMAAGAGGRVAVHYANESELATNVTVSVKAGVCTVNAELYPEDAAARKAEDGTVCWKPIGGLSVLVR